MVSYYNEIDPYAAQWLRNLIDSRLIAEGDVDERSIRDVAAADLRGYTQCHFFAGIGVWSYALRLAGWPDDRPVWTGSCPCQPFSAAGKGSGFADERHLWPEFHRLISECRPPVVFGEQVASKDGLGWLDTVQSDMEASGYALGAADLCAAGVGAPHIRQRLWFVGERLGHHHHQGLEGQRRGHQAEGGRLGAVRPVAEAGKLGGLADAQHNDGRADEPGWGSQGRTADGWDGAACGVADADDAGRQLFPRGEPAGVCGQAAGAKGCEQQLGADSASLRMGDSAGRPSATNGHWRAADWLHCRDGKWRPVEARPQPLADGSAESLGRVRAEAIQEIEEALDAAAMEIEGSRSEVLRALQETLGAQARSVWATGRLPGLHEAPFLLAFLRQLQTEGRCVEEGGALSREEAEAGFMRVLRGDEAAAGSPHRRELEEQRARKSADAVHLLSSLLARHAQASWAHAYETYAEIGFPIGHGSPARVGRLRAYGNAIVPQAAAEVIGAYLDARP